MKRRNQKNIPREGQKVVQRESKFDSPSTAGVIKSHRKICGETSPRVSSEKSQVQETKSKVAVNTPPLSLQEEKSKLRPDFPTLGNNVIKRIATHGNMETAAQKQLAKDGSLRIAKQGLPIPSNYRGNKAPGIDGKPVLLAYREYQENPERILRTLSDGSYEPSPVKRVLIPKGPGKTRPLGIPTAMDRIIQQAILQILTPEVDPYFSDRSHGFRPKRSVFTAAAQLLKQINQEES